MQTTKPTTAQISILEFADTAVALPRNQPGRPRHTPGAGGGWPAGESGP